MVYILADIFLDMRLFDGVEPNDFEARKNALNLLELSRPFPTPFVEFFCSVNDLNLSTDFNFFYWKNYLFKLLTPAVVSSPFSWMLADRENEAARGEKDDYDFIMDTLVRIELGRKLEREELAEFGQADLANREKVREKVIRKVILRDIDK